MFEFSSLSSPSSGSALLQHIPDSSRIESQPSVSLKVIPDVDPHRAVETTDNQPEDDYSGLMEDGLGHDDDDFIDDDDHHDVGVTNCKWVLRVELRSHTTEPDHVYRLGVWCNR